MALKIGIIGNGGISNAHMDGYKALGDRVEVVACCDINFEKAKSYAERYGVKNCYDNCYDMLAENELDAVHPRLLVRLFASPLGVRMLAAEELHREWAFTYRRETEDGAQLLQGVIDCCFIERGAWVLVDYKTDADAAGAIERHRPQLELYAQALAGITGRPVRERVLYLVRAGMGYQV